MTTNTAHVIGQSNAPKFKQALLEQSTASAAISLQRQIDTLVEKLDPLKVELRDLAAGETKTFFVPGAGKVAVSKPTPSSIEDGYILDVESFKRLLPKTQREIISLSLGAVRQEPKVNRASSPKVTITPNV